MDNRLPCWYKGVQYSKELYYIQVILHIKI